MCCYKGMQERCCLAAAELERYTWSVAGNPAIQQLVVGPAAWGGMELPASWCQAALRLLATGSSNGAEVGGCMVVGREMYVKGFQLFLGCLAAVAIWRHGFCVTAWTAR